MAGERTYGVEVVWINSQTGKAAEPGEVTLPASITDGQPILSHTTIPAETYMFEYWDAAVAFKQRALAAPRQPLMRDGKQAHDKGDLLWWVVTASGADESDFEDGPEPEPVEPPLNPEDYDD